MLIVKADGHLAAFAGKLAAMGDGRAEKVLNRALTHTSTKARTAVVRALTTQTGLPRKTLVKAVKLQKSNLAVTLMSGGGDVSLKYFKARETRAGVSAAPWGKRKVFPGTFMRAGWHWPSRVAKASWNGQVFQRTGKKSFRKVKSGLFIPKEMVTGATLDAFQDVIDRDLSPRIAHEIKRLAP